MPGLEIKHESPTIHKRGSSAAIAILSENVEIDDSGKRECIKIARTQRAAVTYNVLVLEYCTEYSTVLY
jgi:hypothetical protein